MLMLKFALFTDEITSQLLHSKHCEILSSIDDVKQSIPHLILHVIGWHKSLIL